MILPPFLDFTFRQSCRKTEGWCLNCWVFSYRQKPTFTKVGTAVASISATGIFRQRFSSRIFNISRPMLLGYQWCNMCKWFCPKIQLPCFHWMWMITRQSWFLLKKKRSSWLPDVPFWKKIPLADGENKASSLRCFRCCKASCISEDLGFQLLWLAFESRKPAQDSSKSWMYSNVVKIYDRWCFWWNISPGHHVGIYLFAAFIATKGTSIGTWHQQTTQWCNDLFSVCDLLPFKERLLGCPSRGEHLRMEWRCVQSFSSISSFSSSSSSTLRGVYFKISQTLGISCWQFLEVSPKKPDASPQGNISIQMAG